MEDDRHCRPSFAKKLNLFLRSYEESIKKVWESRENFDETNSTSPLSWFPFDALPPERDILLTIADLFIALPYDELILKESVLEQLKVAFIFLSLFEEKTLQKKLLQKFEKLLQHYLNKDKRVTNYLNLILVKCLISKQEHDDGNFTNSLVFATEAQEMVKDFKLQFPAEKDNALVRRRLKFLEIEVKICLSYTYVHNDNASEALKLIDDIARDEFINSDQVRSSRTSAFAQSHFDLMLSHVSLHVPISSVHPLYSALSALSNTCVRLELTKPGICQLLRCCDGNPVSTTVPLFKITQSVGSELSFQYEHLEHVFECLYRVAYLWLKSGNLRFALFYIHDGIILSRALCFPEKELKFENLMGEIAMMEQDSEKIKSEIVIMHDILKYIADIEKKNTPSRVHLLSDVSILDSNKEIDSDVEEALNNSNRIEELPDLTFGALDVVNVVSDLNDETASSPRLKRKNLLQKELPKIFTHNKSCECRLCLNTFLKQQLQKLSILSSFYFNLNGHTSEARRSLEESRQHIRQSPEEMVDHCGDHVGGKVCNEELELRACLITTAVKAGDMKSAKLHLRESFEIFEGSEHKVDPHLLPFFHLTAGQILLPEFDQPHFDVSEFVNDVLDFESKAAINTPVIEESLSSQMDRLKLQSSATKPRRILSNKVNIEKGSTKTPPTKRKVSTRTPRKANRKTSSIPSLDGFSIFDENCVDIKLKSDGKSERNPSLPTPVFDGSSVPLKAPPSQKKQKNRKVVFNFSSDEEEDAASAPTSFKTPARRTRASLRIATRNVIAARKEAKLRHRLEKGPVYTNEEIEESRPSTSRKQTKESRKRQPKEKGSPNINASESEDIECPRDSVFSDSVTVPVMNDLDNSVLAAELGNKLNFDHRDCEEYLKKAVQCAATTCNCVQTKTAACLLSLYHYREYDMTRSAAFHLLSVGVTLRITSHIDLKFSIRSMERKMKQETSRDSAWIYHMKTMKDTVDRSHPAHVISSMRDCDKFVDEICVKIPSEWTVCLLSSFHEGHHDVVMVTRLRHAQKPLHLQLKVSSLSRLSSNFDQFILNNVEGMKSRDKSVWWTERRNANRTLEEFLKDLEKQVLGNHRGVLLGYPVEQKCRDDLQKCVDDLTELLFKKGGTNLSHCRDLIEIYSFVWKNLSAEEKTRVIVQLLRSAQLQPNKTLLLDVAAEFGNYRNHLRCHRCKRGHVVLILDKRLQAFPWESIGLLHRHSVSRMPSIDALLWQLELNKMTSYSKADLHQVSYVINPKADLAKTEMRFAEWFSSIQSWSGAMSRVPNKNEWLSYISDRDVFIFCGHGSGSAFMHRETIARRRNRASALLMGCSSGLLNEKGVTEPEGMALAYLMSGSPCVLACLWPVTDKDIDKYLTKCLCEWMNEDTALTDVVRKAEDVCKFPRLTGAACVVYGIPVKSYNAIKNWSATIPSHFQELVS